MRPRTVYEFGRFRLDASDLVLLKDGASVPINRKAAETLAALVANHGELVSKDQLLTTVWPDAFVEEGVLSRNVCDIRKVIEDRAGSCIQTVPKRGYRFVAPVRVVSLTQRRPTTLVIAPFRLLGAAPGNEHLGVALADAITARLAAIPQVIVRASSVVFKLAASHQKPESVARALKADSVLDGTLQVSRDRVRLRLQLMSVADGNCAWARTFDQSFSDLFELEDRVAEAVASGLALRISGNERERLSRPSTKDGEAYQLYLKARYFFSHPKSDDLAAPLRYCEQALRRDPNFAECHSALAIWYTVMVIYADGNPSEFIPKAKSQALRALECNQDQQEARAALAFALWHHDFEWDAAEAELHRLIEINPSEPTNYHYYAMLLMETRRFDRALEQLKIAENLDPSSWILFASEAMVLCMAGRYDEAITSCELALQMDTNCQRALWTMALAKLQNGQTREAVRYLRKARKVSNATPDTAALAHALAANGDLKQARKLVEELESAAQTGYVSSSDLALPNVALGDHDRAFYYLFRAVRERAVSLCLVDVDPRFEPLRSDPRFETLLGQINLRNAVGASV